MEQKPSIIFRPPAPGTVEKCEHLPRHGAGHYRCACLGCWCCSGKELDCTCDVDWERLNNK